MQPAQAIHPGQPIQLPVKKAPTTCQKVGRVFLWILYTIAATVLMVFTAPIFFVAVIIGITCKKWMLSLVEKVKQIWINRPGATFGLTLLATALAFPIPLMTASVVIGGYLGVRFANYARIR